MARITVEDCIDVVNNQYDLVILAKERAVQLGRGAAPAVDADNDKKPVIALREIAEEKITEEELSDSIVDKLRLIPDYVEEEVDIDETSNDTFRQMYRGGLSKSEMEKPASRKFTARIPKPEIKPEINEEILTDADNADIAISEESNFDEPIVDQNIVSEPGEVSLQDVVLDEAAIDVPVAEDAIEEAISSEIEVEESTIEEQSPEVESAEEVISIDDDQEQV